MKRIIAALICVSMCCIFILPLAAQTFVSHYTLTDIYFSTVRGYQKNGSSSPVIYVQENMLKQGPNFYEITTDKVVLFEESLVNYDLVAGLNFKGSFDKIDGIIPDSYVSFNVSLRVTEDRKIDFDDALNEYVRLQLPDKTDIYNYFFSKMNDYQYQLNFVVPVSGTSYNYLDISYFYIYLPVKWVYDSSTDQNPFFMQIMVDDISITYDSIPITSADVELIINDLDSIDTTVSAIKDQIDILPSNIASELKGIDLGSVETAAIPYDQLEDIQDIEDQLYDYSDSKVQYIGQSIDQLGSTLNNHIGKVSTGHGLFFTRVFEINFIRDLVYISLGFGLVAFILRLGRKIQ